MVQKSNQISVNSVKGVPKSSYPSLGRDDHVRQVIPDRHPITVRNSTVHHNNKTLKIGTWNVRTMYQKGKLDNIIMEMKRMEINILGLSEVRWKGAGIMKTQNTTMVYSGGDEHHRGVGLLLDSQCSNTLKGFWAVNDRIIVAKLNGKPFDIGIVQAYAPTADKDEEEVEKFYEDLDKAMKQLKSQDIKIVMGDFNSKVGSEKVENIVGPFGIGKTNERGERLIDWCRENKFIVTNSWFQNHPRRCWTWKSPGDRTRNQIDFILIQERFRNSITSSKSMPGADCGSDHVPVISHLKVKLKKLKKPERTPRLDFQCLRQDNDLKNAFTISIKNKFEILDSLTTADERWQKMKECIHETTSALIPETTGKVHKKWMNENILNLMEERRKAKHNNDKYTELDKKIKTECNKAKERWINSQCQKIENNRYTDTKCMHQRIKEVTGQKSTPKSGCIKSKTGDILMDKADILKRWSEYIEELFHDTRGPPPAIENIVEGPTILKEEVEHALSKMKLGKATGPDRIPAEVFLALDDLGITEITKLMNIIYDSGEIPVDMKRSIFIALPKKPGTTDCEQHRTISLMSHLTKVLLRIIMKRVRNKLDPEISETQFGFVPDSGTRNAIFTLQTLMERSIEVQRDLYLCFIDYSKAFDRVKHEELFKILKQLNLDGKDLRILQNLYWEQEAALRVENEYSEFKPICRGVRQGCVLSPDLFNIYSEMILRKISDYDGVKVNGHNINNLRYADDTVLIADSEKQLQKILSVVSKESKKRGLDLNAKKTECMVVSKKEQIPACNINCEGEKIKQVDKFKYLGFMVTPDGRCDTEIQKRIAIAKNTFNKMSSLLKNRNISMDTKMRIIKSYVWSVFLYGCECWNISNNMKKKLEATEMWFIRRLLRISWTEKKTNEEVLQQAGLQRTLMKTIRKRQLEFFGHANRKEGLEKLVLCGKIEGKKGRGRPRLSFMDSLNAFATNKTKTNNNLIQLTGNRTDWRTMTVDACIRPDT